MIHSHAVYATMFATIREPVPAVIEEVIVYIGGDVPVCEYKATGTDELGDEVARNLADRSAALLANHGMVTIGATPAQGAPRGRRRRADRADRVGRPGARRHHPPPSRRRPTRTWPASTGYLRDNPM